MHYWNLYEFLIKKNYIHEAALIKKAGISDVVFHATSIYNLSSILKENRLMTTLQIATPSESSELIPRLNKYFYFLSTMRNLSSDYKAAYNKYSYIQLDGKKISESFAGEPFDYWQNNKTSEQEDRIITNLPYVEGVDKYINKILIYFKIKNLNSYEDISNLDIKTLEDIKDFSEKLGIDVYVFENFSDLRLRNIKRSRSIQDTISILKEDISKNKIQYREIPDFPVREIGDDNYWVQYVMNIKNFSEKVLSGNIDRSIFNSRLWKDFSNDYYVNDIKRALKNELHNIRAKPEYRKYLDSFVRIMKKYSIKNIDDLISKLSTIIKLHKPYVIISACLHENNNNENYYLSDLLKSDLFAFGYYDFDEVNGEWNNKKEKSFKIDYFPVYKAIELAKKYKQDAIYISDGLEGEIYYIEY
jgi:hypothetical protein